MLENFLYSIYFVCFFFSLHSKYGNVMELLRIGREHINHRYIDSDMFFRTLSAPVCIWNILMLPVHEYIPEACVCYVM